jgi:hypothetical protein
MQNHAGLWMVRERLRHARFEGGEDVARRAARLKINFENGLEFVAVREAEIGPLRQAAFFGPTVANGALRTWLDLLLATFRRKIENITLAV